MLRLRENPLIRYIRSGRCCRTARYIPVVARRIEFLFSVSSIKVNNSAAAMRDATPPLFRQSFPMQERETFRYGSVRSGYRPGFSFSRFRLVDSAAALRDATPPLFSLSNAHFFDIAYCDAAGFSDGSFQVSNTYLPARRTWPSGYPLSEAGRAPWLGPFPAGNGRPADTCISLPCRVRPRGASRKGSVDYAEPRPFHFLCFPFYVR